MRHVAAFVGAFILLGFAAAVLWFSRTNLTMAHLCFVGGFVAVAFALAIPADFKQACETVAPYLPQVRGRGTP